MALSNLLDPSGFIYKEYYLYSNKEWETIPSGTIAFDLNTGVMQNAPIIVTSSGFETTLPTDPWGQVSGAGKYTKVGYGQFTKNNDGSVNTCTNEFSLHPDSSGRLVFNKAAQEHLFVEYEGSASGYYIFDRIDFNPLRNEAQTGFVHWVSTSSQASNLNLSVSPGSIWADGSQFVRLTATIYDQNLDRLPNRVIDFEIQGLAINGGLTPVSGVYSGIWSDQGWLEPVNGTTLMVDASGAGIKVRGTTDTRGEAKAVWHPYVNVNALQTFKAYDASASGLFDTASVLQRYFITQPFTLDLSLLDTTDYLTGDPFVYIP